MENKEEIEFTENSTPFEKGGIVHEATQIIIPDGDFKEFFKKTNMSEVLIEAVNKTKPKQKQKKKLNMDKTKIFEQPVEVNIEFPILKNLDSNYCKQVIAMCKKYSKDISNENTKIIELEVNEAIPVDVDNALVNSEYVIVVSSPKWNKFNSTLNNYFQINHKLVLNLLLPVINGRQQINFTIFLHKKIK